MSAANPQNAVPHSELRSLSAFESEQTSDIAAAEQDPELGSRAYLNVIGCFLAYFMTLGLSSTFGSYQAYYQETLLQGYSPSSISWIGTLQVFLLSFVGFPAGALHDRGYVRVVLAGGLSLIVLGLFMLSLARTYWQVLLAQGICIGLGCGLIYVPAVSIVSTQYKTHRAQALGVAATGSAIGGVLLPIMFRSLLPAIGLDWTNRVFGFLFLVLATICYGLLVSASAQSHARTSNRGSTITSSTSRKLMVDIRSAFANTNYVALCGGVFFTFLGYWIPLFYIIPFALTSLGVAPAQAPYLLSILNAGSFFGRLLPPFLSQKLGSPTILFLGSAVFGTLIFVWMVVSTFASVVAWSFLIGFFSGIVVSIPNAVVTRVCQGLDNVGLTVGMMWLAGAMAELTGSPIAGALIHQKDTRVDYTRVQTFAGLSTLVGCACLLLPAWSTFHEDKRLLVRHV